MDRTKPESPEGIGSVKAAISIYGERIHGRTHAEDPPMRSRELRLAKFDIGRLNESKKVAEKEIALAESELYKARSAAKELAQKIEDSSTEARARMLERQQPRKPEGSKGGDTDDRDVLRELRSAEEELSRLKLDVASALEAKAKAEKEIEASSSRTKSNESIAEELRKEIAEASEEHVLVELARIEAERELRVIEAQRAAEAVQLSKNMEIAKKKINDLRSEINRAKELEMMLAATNSDVDFLQNEMELVREMERNTQKNPLVGDADKRREDESSESSSLLRSAEMELKAAKKELETVKEEGFQLMVSMDLVRDELTRIAIEKERLKKLERKADSTVQNLNSKLLKAKSKLESTSMADERAQTIVSNLSAALQQLRTEIEATKEKKEAICKETDTIRNEIEKTDLEIKSAEEGLQAAMQELEGVKESEALAIKKLRHVSQKIMRNRASSSLHGSTVTISKSEYDYLRKRAVAAQLVADKKVAAAQAWIEALEAGEKEIVMKSEFTEREIKKLRVLKEQQLCETEKSMVAQRSIEEELYRRQNEEAKASNIQLAKAARSKSIRENGIHATTRRVKMRKAPASPRMRHETGSPSFTIKKRTVMPTVKFLGNQKIGKQK